MRHTILARAHLGSLTTIILVSVFLSFGDIYAKICLFASLISQKEEEKKDRSILNFLSISYLSNLFSSFQWHFESWKKKELFCRVLSRILSDLQNVAYVT